MLTTTDIRAGEAANLIRELIDDYLLVPSEKFLRQADMVLDIAGELVPTNQREALSDEIVRARNDPGARKRRRVLDLMNVVAESTRTATAREESTRESDTPPSTQGDVAEAADRSSDR